MTDVPSMLASVLGYGPESARPLPDLARALGVSTRAVQEAADELIARGVLVCSSCGERSGLFVPRDEAELAAGTRHMVRRAVTTLRRVRAMRSLAERTFGPQTGRLFELEEVG